MRHRRLAGALLAGCVLAAGAAGPARAGNAPPEPCVPGTVWEDLGSGVKYICIYDEIYGGSRWEVLASSQSKGEASFRSPSFGCARVTIGLSGLSGGGGDTMIRTSRWPCDGPGDRVAQPAGELRVRAVLQRYTTAWGTCRDTGYIYNTTTAFGWVAGLDMGTAPDCGVGYYRTWGVGGFYQGGAWRVTSTATPSLWID